jgi:hypothetical protein
VNADSQLDGVCRTSHVTRHTSHVTRHTSHVTRHTPHVTRHTSHVTYQTHLTLVSILENLVATTGASGKVSGAKARGESSERYSCCGCRQMIPTLYSLSANHGPSNKVITKSTGEVVSVWSHRMQGMLRCVTYLRLRPTNDLTVPKT